MVLRVAGGMDLELAGHREVISARLREMADRVDGDAAMDVSTLVIVLGHLDGGVAFQRYGYPNEAIGTLERAKQAIIDELDE